MKIECVNGPLRVGENDARILALTVEEAYASHEIRLAFLTPFGHKCLSPEIRVENGVVSYPLPACLLDATGKLLAQIVAENGEGQVAKSDVYAFPVERSILCDDGDFTDEGFVTIGMLDNAVKALQADVVSLSPAAFSGSYADLTDTPELPVIPQNVSAFTNDAGYLTQHQSLADYYTADETDAAVHAAVTEAITDPATFVIDETLSGTSENAVQNKVIKAALDAKADATAVQVKVGTFTPAFEPQLGSYVVVKQIGKIVYIYGLLGTDDDWGTAAPGILGNITGVDGPATVATIPVMSGDGTDMHAGYISTALGVVGANVKDTDDIIMINGYYFTE